MVWASRLVSCLLVLPSVQAAAHEATLHIKSADLKAAWAAAFSELKHETVSSADGASGVDLTNVLKTGIVTQANVDTLMKEANLFFDKRAQTIDFDDDENATVTWPKGLSHDLNSFWLIFGGVLVFFMQPGFALLEAGSVRVKNTKNILFKNVCDACVGALGFWSIGYSIAYAGGSSKFMGTDGESGGWFMTGSMYLDDEAKYDGPDYAGWFFQFAFAATAATIVSGAVAERISFVAYLCATCVLTCFVYPVVVHWGWSGAGWASAFYEGSDKLLFDVGATDFAGCAIVHMTGGCAAFVGVIVTGARTGRFVDGKPVQLAQQSAVLQALGVFILWFGWYGFNCVSTLALSGGAAGVAAKTAVTTTLSPAMSCGTCMFLAWLLSGRTELSLGAGLNGILAGLVGITSACSVVEPWAAVVIGALSGFVYIGSSRLMLMLRLDDAVDAVPVHMFCGMWGCIAPALFASERNYGKAYRESDHYGLFYGGGGKMLAANVCFILAVLAWVSFTMLLVFMALKMAKVLRVSEEVERLGMDVAKHGGLSFVEGVGDVKQEILMQYLGKDKMTPHTIVVDNAPRFITPATYES